MRKNYFRNIKLFYILHFFRWTTFFAPIWVLFYQSIGLNFTQILSTFAIRSIASIVFEVPSGVFADYFGRNRSLQLSLITFMSGFLILSTAQNYLTVFFANLLIGTATAFSSGADIALVYDSLSASQRRLTFKRIQSNLWVIRCLGIGTGSILSGFLAVILGLRLPVFLNVVCQFMALIISFFIKEPPLKTENTDRRYFDHLAISAKMIFKKPPLLLISIFGSLYLVTVLTSFTLQQSYMTLVNIPLEYMGVLIAIFLAVSSFAAVKVTKISKYMNSIVGEITVSWILVVGAFALLGFIINPILGIILIAIGQFSQGLTPIIVSHFSNERIQSRNRATALSFQGFLNDIFVFALLPVFGKVTDWYGVNGGFLSLSLFLGLLGGIILILFQQKLAKEVKTAALP